MRSGRHYGLTDDCSRVGATLWVGNYSNEGGRSHCGPMGVGKSFILL